MQDTRVRFSRAYVTMCGLDVGAAWAFTKAVDMASAMHTATAMAEKGFIATTVNRVCIRFEVALGWIRLSQIF